MRMLVVVVALEHPEQIVDRRTVFSGCRGVLGQRTGGRDVRSTRFLPKRDRPVLVRILFEEIACVQRLGIFEPSVASPSRADARSASPARASWTKISTSTTRWSRSRATWSRSARTKRSGSKRFPGSRTVRSVLSATENRLRTFE